MDAALKGAEADLLPVERKALQQHAPGNEVVKRLLELPDVLVGANAQLMIRVWSEYSAQSSSRGRWRSSATVGTSMRGAGFA